MFALTAGVLVSGAVTIVALSSGDPVIGSISGGVLALIAGAIAYGAVSIGCLSWLQH